MSNKQFPLSWITLTAAITGLVICICATLILVAAVRRSTAQSDTSAGRRVTAPQSKPAKKDHGESAEMVQITVLPTGFEPSEIEYPSKPFLFAVDNQSGLEDLDLQLVSQDSDGKSHEHIRDFKMSLKAKSNREMTFLRPGLYVLKEANHPEWSCLFKISEK